ncbi:MAG: Electron transfer flavoprotein subunit beta/FixA family protein [Thermodesulfobacteriota bacterium]|nr:Electron transfer flavoprotein subunit beta/FixA family protein [Thermodesulfobacteriota bacterium]
MDIIVCIKSVSLTAGSEGALRSYDAVEVNPFDRPAIETALSLREARGGTVTALSMGPASTRSTLAEALAMGVDRGVLACDPAFAGSDTLATSTVLASAIRKLSPFDLVLFGMRTADSDTGQVGPQTAVLLDIPMVGLVHSIEPADNGLQVERTADHFTERFEIEFPAALTIHPGAIKPRDIHLARIGPVFEEEKITFWNLGDLSLSPEQVGDAGSPTRVLSVSRAIQQKKCEFLKGSALEQADALMRQLTEAGMMG